MGKSISQIEAEVREIEYAWDDMISAGQIDQAQAMYGDMFAALNRQLAEAKSAGIIPVVRLRFLAGESSRNLDAACGRAIGWRVDEDAWWNWHPGPRYDPPGDAWCIRKDGRNDVPCNEALPRFTAESFEQALKAKP